MTDLVNKKLYLNKICSPSKNLPLIIHISHMKTVKTKHPSLQRTKIHSLAPTLTQSFTFLVHTTHYHSLCTWILDHTQTYIHEQTYTISMTNTESLFQYRSMTSMLQKQNSEKPLLTIISCKQIHTNHSTNH